MRYERCSGMTSCGDSATVVSAESTTGIRLPYSGVMTDAKWAPHGDKLALSVSSAFSGMDLYHGTYIVDADGTDLITVTEDTTDISWAPVDNQLAFSKDDSIYVTDDQGSTPRKIVSQPFDFYVWSPNSQYLAVSATPQLLLVNTTSGESTNIGGDAYAGSGVLWSPDSRFIVFAKSTSLLLYSLEDKSTRVLTDKLGAVNWSSATPTLAYSVGETIFTITPDQASPTPVITGISSWNWMPDGRQILFTRKAHIYLANADGSGEHEIPALAQSDSYTFSPNGELICTIQVSEKSVTAKIIRTDGSTVASWDGECGAWSVDSAYIASHNDNLGHITKWTVRRADGTEVSSFNMDAASRVIWSPK